MATWHTSCLKHRVPPPPPSASVDVILLDSPHAVGLAFGAPQADAESTHLLCRHRDEAAPDFVERVARRVERIRKTRPVRSIWLVVGAGGSGRCLPAQLLSALSPALESGASLTLVGPRSDQHAVFACVDSVLRRRGNVSVSAQLYNDDAERAPRSARNAARTSPALRLGAQRFALDSSLLPGPAGHAPS